MDNKENKAASGAGGANAPATAAAGPGGANRHQHQYKNKGKDTEVRLSRLAPRPMIASNGLLIFSGDSSPSQ
jgi:hypothetical protein